MNYKFKVEVPFTTEDLFDHIPEKDASHEAYRNIVREMEEVVVTFDVVYTPPQKGCWYLPNGDPGYPDEPAEVEAMLVPDSINPLKYVLEKYLKPEQVPVVLQKFIDLIEQDGEAIGDAVYRELDEG